MLGSFSIFLKICPECAGEMAVAAERCGCGHVFETAHANHLTPDELALRDEELYESYLAARVEQAHQAVGEAEFALAEDPRNLIRVQTAELTREAAASMEANLSAQRGKVAALRRLVELARPKPPAVVPTRPIIMPPVVTPVRAPAVAAQRPETSSRTPATRAPALAEPPAAPISVAPQAPEQSPAATAPAPLPAEKAARERRAIRETETREVPAKPIIAPPVEARSAAAVPAAPRAARGSMTSSTSAPRAPVTAEPSARPVSGTSRPQKDPAVPTPRAKTLVPAPRLVPASAIKPSARASQSGVRSGTPAQPSKPLSAPVITSTPPDNFRAEQAARAERALKKKQTEAVERYPGWDCPNCTATVPENSGQCACGYSYHAGTNDLPTLSPVAGMSAVSGGPQDSESRRR